MSVFVDGVDLADFGFRVRRRTGDLVPVVARPASVAVPGGFGERPTGALAQAAPRSIQVVGTLMVDTAGEFVAALRALQYWVTGRTGAAEPAAVQLSFGAQGSTPAVAYTAYLDPQTQFDRRDPQRLATVGDLTLTFWCLDPLARDAAATTLPLSAAARACPVGTARTRPVTILDGPFSARSIILTDGAGVTRGGLTITGAVDSGETVEIDHAAESIVHDDGLGTRTARPEWLTAGDFFALDPAQCTVDAAPLLATAGQGDVGSVFAAGVGQSFDGVVLDRFGTDTSGNYASSGLTVSYQGTSGVDAGTGKLRLAAAAAGSLTATLPNVPGAQYPFVVLRYRTIVGGPGAVPIDVSYQTAAHGYIGSYHRAVSLTGDGQWYTLVLDMRQLTAGGSDWTDSAIEGLRIALLGTSTIELNGLAVASAAPLRAMGRTLPRLALDGGTGLVTLARGWR